MSQQSVTASKRDVRLPRSSTKWVGGSGHWCRRGANTKPKGKK